MSFENLLIEATNAYWTKYFSLVQAIGLNDDGVESADFCRRDTNFRRKKSVTRIMKKFSAKESRIYFKSN